MADIMANFCEFCGQELLVYPVMRYNQQNGDKYVSELILACPEVDEPYESVGSGGSIFSGMFVFSEASTSHTCFRQDREKTPSYLIPYLERA